MGLPTRRMNPFGAGPTEPASSESRFPGFPNLDPGRLGRAVRRRIWFAMLVRGLSWGSPWLRCCRHRRSMSRPRPSPSIPRTREWPSEVSRDCIRRAGRRATRSSRGPGGFATAPSSPEASKRSRSARGGRDQLVSCHHDFDPQTGKTPVEP